MSEYIDLIIRNRKGVLLQTQVDSFSSYNAKGKFDILPRHANFISLVEKLVTYTDKADKDKKLKEFKIERALLKVSSNKAEIFLGL